MTEREIVYGSHVGWDRFLTLAIPHRHVGGDKYLMPEAYAHRLRDAAKSMRGLPVVTRNTYQPEQQYRPAIIERYQENGWNVTPDSFEGAAI